jgi:hypothetical protein
LAAIVEMLSSSDDVGKPLKMVFALEKSGGRCVVSGYQPIRTQKRVREGKECREV